MALHYDAQAQQDLGIDKTRIDTGDTISDIGLYGSIAGGGGLYLLGLATHNDRLAETGRLGEEAIAKGLNLKFACLCKTCLWRRLAACVLAVHKKASVVAGLKGGSR